MKVIYIAGRYRDPRGEFYVKANIEEAAQCALFVWKFGGVALCPHKNTSHFGGALGIPDETWLKGDLELLTRCDAVWFIPGWESSAGARAEEEFAKQIALPCLYDQRDVLNYLDFETPPIKYQCSDI